MSALSAGQVSRHRYSLSAWNFLLRHFLLCLVFLGVFSLGGCSLRLDTAPPVLPSLTPQQEALLKASTCEEAIGKAQLELSSAHPQPFGQVLSQAAQRSAKRLEASGGRWNPWPQGKPENAEPGPEPVPVPKDLPGLLQTMAQCAFETRQGIERVEDGNVAQFLSAQSAALQLEASSIALSSGQPFVLPQSLAVEPSVVSPSRGKDLHSDLDIVVQQLDNSRFLLETLGSFVDRKQSQVFISRADHLAAEVDLLLTWGAKLPADAALYVAPGLTDIGANPYPDKTQVQDHILQAYSQIFSAHQMLVALLQGRERNFWAAEVAQDAARLYSLGLGREQIFNPWW